MPSIGFFSFLPPFFGGAAARNGARSISISSPLTTMLAVSSPSNVIVITAARVSSPFGPFTIVALIVRVIVPEIGYRVSDPGAGTTTLV